MSRNTLSVLGVLLATFLWWWICHHWYVCDIKQVCDDGRTEEVAKAPEDKRPLLFKFSNGSPIVNSTTFPDFKTRILAGKKEGNMLEIEGLYFDGEDESVGLARAEAIKKLFLDKVPEDRIRITTRKVNKAPDKVKPFEAAKIFWIEGDKKTADARNGGDEKEGDEKEETIVRLADRILIYHLFGSTQKTVDPKVDEYIGKLAQRLTQTNENVSLTGHTDNVGDEDKNNQLGLDRANYIKNLLVAKGVPANRIRVSSKGETAPIATNETDAGRAKNRRTELLLVN